MQEKITKPRPMSSYILSFADVSSEAVELDLPLVGVGYFLMFTYTMIMLGKINMVEHREAIQ